MTTLKQLSEQVKRLLTGNPSYNMEITTSEIKLMVVQVISSLLKVQKAQIFAQAGDDIPPSATIATYDNIAVQSYGTFRSISILPAYPMALAMNMGVWQISDINNPDSPFIPLQSGQWGIANPLQNQSYLAGLIGYENEGLNIIYTTDITKRTPYPITKVRVKLLVTDPTLLKDTDLLPIPQDMEGDVIRQVFQLMALEPVQEHYDNGKDERRPIR